jgi:hypothetical protein
MGKQIFSAQFSNPPSLHAFPHYSSIPSFRLAYTVNFTPLEWYQSRVLWALPAPLSGGFFTKKSMK